MGRLHLSLLGGFQVRLASGPALPVPARKAQALLAYLALPPGQAHQRDRLATLLWGETGDAHARTSLRQTLFGLRRVLPGSRPPLLVTKGETVALSAQGVEVDALAFQQRIGEGTPAALERAVALYHGDLLDGFALNEPAFESWLLSERERLRELALEALTRLLGQQRKAGATEAAIQTAARLLTLDPLQEAVHRALMELYARQGRRPAALRQYQLCVAALQRELGVEPEADTRRLYQEVLQQRRVEPPRPEAAPAPARRPRAAAPLPARLRPPAAEVSLIGRARELDALRAAWSTARQGRGRLAMVLGEAGIGKTRLVDELVAEAGPHVLVGRAYQSEQILPFGPWVEALRTARVLQDPAVIDALGPAWQAELARLFPELGEAALPAPTGSEDYVRLFDALAHLIGQLAGRQPLLLVLEDLHWADEMSQRLVAFLTRRAAKWPALLVATAREEALPDAPVLRQALHELDREGRVLTLTLPPLSRQETAAMVRSLARLGDSDARLARLGEQVWAASEGNPFMVVELVRAVEELAAPEVPPALPLPRRIREVILERLDRLRPASRALVGVAAVIGREFDFALAQRAAGLSEREAAEALEELVRRRIVRVSGERFDLAHERIREVAYGELLPPRRALLHRQVAEALEALYADDLVPHFAALAAHCRAGELWPKAVHYLGRVAEQAARRYALEDSAAALQEAVAHAQRLPAEARDLTVVDLVLRQSSCLNFLGRLGDSLALLLQHRDGVERIASPTLSARFYFRLGTLSSYLGQHDRALASVDRAIAEAIRCQDTKTEGMAYSVLAMEAVWTGRYWHGVEQARRAIALLESTAERRGLGSAYFHLANNWYHLGMFAPALEAGRRAETLGAAPADPRLVACGAWSVGIAHASRGDVAESLAACQRALAAAPDPLNTEVARGFLGYACFEAGDYERAVALLEEARGRLGQFRYPQFEGLFTTVLSEALHLAGRPGQAREVASRGLALTTETRYALGIGFAQRSLGRLARAAGDLAEAARQLEAALQTYTDVDSRFEAARTRLDLALVAHARGESPVARAQATEARRLFAELDVPRYVEQADTLARGLGLLPDGAA